MTRLPAQSEPWYAVLPHDSAAGLAGVRLCPGIEIAATAEEIWLRGKEFTPEIAAVFRGVSGLEWREPLSGNRWRLPGHRLPDGTLPEDLLPSDWHPLARALVPEIPDSALAEPLASRLPLQVVRGGSEQPANILLLPLRDLAQWAETTPHVRLKPLRFAVNTEGRALVFGTPLPPLPGEAWWESGGIALPCGFHLDPELSPAVIKTLPGIQPDRVGGLTLLHPSGEAEHIPSETIVSLNRGSVRMSLAVLETPR